jgi:hypothetical protein
LSNLNKHYIITWKENSTIGSIYYITVDNDLQNKKITSTYFTNSFGFCNTDCSMYLIIVTRGYTRNMILALKYGDWSWLLIVYLNCLLHDGPFSKQSCFLKCNVYNKALIIRHFRFRLLDMLFDRTLIWIFVIIFRFSINGTFKDTDRLIDGWTYMWKYLWLILQNKKISIKTSNGMNVDVK